MKLLCKLLHKRRWLSAAAICASVLAAAIALWWNTQLSDIINLVSEGVSPSKDMILCSMVTMLAMGTTNYVKSYILGYTGEGMTHDLRMGYARHYASLPVAQIEKLNAGEQLSKLQNEIAGASGYLNGSLFQLLDDSVKLLSCLTWLFFVNPSLTLASNAPAFIIMGYVLWSSKVIGSAAELSQSAKCEMNRSADTLLALFPVIRLYDATRWVVKQYADTVKKWEHQTIRLERTKARLMSLSGVLGSIPLLFLFLVGGNMVIGGSLTIGGLYIFLNLSGNVSGVLLNMPSHVADFRQFTANAKRLAPNVLLIKKGR